jgi:hypothetical protein
MSETGPYLPSASPRTSSRSIVSQSASVSSSASNAFFIRLLGGNSSVGFPGREVEGRTRCESWPVEC